MNAFNESKQTTIASEVDKAASYIDRMIGLLGRKNIPEKYGLWITPCKSIQTFFMRFPIDVVFLSSSLQVVRVMRNVKPFRISPIVFSAQSVIELPIDSIDGSKTDVGDQVIFRP